MVLLYQDSQVPQQLTDTPLLAPLVPMEATRREAMRREVMPSSSLVLHLEDIPLLVLTVPPLPTELPVLTALLLMVLPPLMAHQLTVLLDTAHLTDMIAVFPPPVSQVLYQA